MRVPRLLTNRACSPAVADSSRDRQPGCHRLARKAADRHDTCLVAFAGDAHGVVARIDIAKIQARQFRKSQPRGIEEFQHGAVADGVRFAALDLQQPGHLVGVEGIGEPARHLWRGHVRARVALQCAFTNQVFHEAAHARQATLDAPWCQASRHG
jgi:hypothetical protein